jgi:hypothetical protein
LGAFYGSGPSSAELSAGDGPIRNASRNGRED